MGISAMNASLKANDIRKRRPGFIKSSDAKRIRSKSLIKRRATQKELELIKAKIKGQNRLDYLIYSIVIIGFIIGIYFLY
ncbi:MAG: hypothetical protein ACPG6V_12465 [Flavobacteriales bacterium]